MESVKYQSSQPIIEMLEETREQLQINEAPTFNEVFISGKDLFIPLTYPRESEENARLVKQHFVTTDM